MPQAWDSGKMSEHKSIYFILDAEPTAAQQEHCRGWRKAFALEKWLCTLQTNGNVTMLGSPLDALSTKETRAAITQAGWREPPPEPPATDPNA